MPILLKKIEGSIISLFGNNDRDFIGEVKFITSFVGEVGIEDYVLTSTFEGLVQDFSKIIEADICDTIAVNFGPNSCSNYTDLTISY